MAVNEFDVGVRRQPRQTYVSQHVKMPFRNMMALMSQRQKDADIGHAIEDKAAGFLDMKVLQQDKDLMKLKAAKYTTDMEDIITQADGDYSRVGSKLTGVARNIREDMNRGQMGAMAGNLATYQATTQELDKRLKDGKITDTAYRTTMREAMDRYGEGVEHEQMANYKAMNIRDVVDYQDIGSAADKIVEGFKADGSKVGNFQMTEDGRWIKYTDSGREYVDPQVVADYTARILQQNKPLMESLRQEAFAEGYGAEEYNEGEYANQYVTDQINKVSRSMSEKYGYMKTEDKERLEADPYGRMKAQDQIDNPQIVIGTDGTITTKIPGLGSEQEFDKHLENLGENIKTQDTEAALAFFGGEESYIGRDGARGRVMAAYNADIMTSMTPAEKKKYQEDLELVDKSKSFMETGNLTNILDPKKRKRLAEAHKNIDAVEAKGWNMFHEDLKNGDASFSGGIEISGPEQKALLQNINSAKRTKATYDNIEFELDRKRKFGTMWSSDDKEMMKMIAEQNMYAPGIGVKKNGKYQIKGSVDGETDSDFDMELSGQQMNELNMAFRKAGERDTGIFYDSEGRTGKYKGWTVTKESDTDLEMSNSLALETAAGVTAPSAKEVKEGTTVHPSVWKVTSPEGKTFYTSSALNGNTPMGNIIKRRESAQTDAITNNNWKKLTKQVLNENELKKSTVHMQTSYGTVSYIDPATGLANTVDTWESAKAVDYALTGSKRDGKQAITMDKMAKGYGSHYTWKKNGTADEMTFDQMVDHVIDEEGIEDTMDNRELVRKRMTMAYPMFFSSDDRLGGKPTINVSYKINSPYKSINGNWSMDTRNIDGHAFGTVANDAALIASTNLSNVKEGQSIISPVDAGTQIGYRQLAQYGGGYVLYVDPEKPLPSHVKPGDIFTGKNGKPAYIAAENPIDPNTGQPLRGTNQEVLGQYMNFVIEAKEQGVY